MNLRIFGNTNERVYPIGIGTYGHGNAYGQMSSADSFEVLLKTFSTFQDKGPIFVDTAPLYGSGLCETIIGEVLQNHCFSQKILIATKAGREILETNFNQKNFSREFILKDIHQSLQRLKTDRIFLLQLHNPSLFEIRKNNLFDLLEKIRTEGLISYYGVSINDSQEGLEIIEYSRNQGFNGMVSIQLIYNILNKQSLQQLISLAMKNNIAIIAREPLMRGFITDSRHEIDSFKQKANVEARKKLIDLYTDEQILNRTNEVFDLIREYGTKLDPIRVAIEFALKNRAVTVTIPGIKKVEHIETFSDFTFNSMPEKLYEALLNLENIKQLKN